MDARRSLGDGQCAPVPRRATASSSPRADLGSLIEAENDWHRDSRPAHHAAAADHRRHDRAAAAAGRAARAYVETLFG